MNEWMNETKCTMLVKIALWTDCKDDESEYLFFALSTYCYYLYIAPYGSAPNSLGVSIFNTDKSTYSSTLLLWTLDITIYYL